jgi:hypothetical protein
MPAESLFVKSPVGGRIGRWNFEIDNPVAHFVLIEKCVLAPQK